MPPPKRPGPRQNLVAKVNNFYQTAKDLLKKLQFVFESLFACSFLWGRMLSFDGSESVWGVYDFSDDDSCYCHTEGSGDVAERAVDLRLRRTPFVLH